MIAVKSKQQLKRRCLRCSKPVPDDAGLEMCSKCMDKEECWPDTAELKSQGIANPNHHKSMRLLGFAIVKHVPKNQKDYRWDPRPFDAWLKCPKAELVRIDRGERGNHLILPVVTIDETEYYTNGAVERLLNYFSPQVVACAARGDIKHLDDKVAYIATNGGVKKGYLYPRESVDKFKPKLATGRRKKSHRRQHAKTRARRNGKAPTLVDGFWLPRSGELYASDCVAEEHYGVSADKLRRGQKDGLPELDGCKPGCIKKRFNVPEGQCRKRWVTPVSELKQIRDHSKAAVERPNDPDWFAPAIRAAGKWLVSMLSDGPKQREEVLAAGKAAGFSVSQIGRTARKLGVCSKRINAHATRSSTGQLVKGSVSHRAEWSLPESIAAKYRKKIAAAGNGHTPDEEPVKTEPPAPLANMEDPIAVVWIVRQLGQIAGRSDHLAERMKRRGYPVVKAGGKWQCERKHAKAVFPRYKDRLEAEKKNIS